MYDVVCGGGYDQPPSKVFVLYISTNIRLRRTWKERKVFKTYLKKLVIPVKFDEFFSVANMNFEGS